MTVTKQILNEQVVEGRRLGRHIVHDSTSWRFPAPMSDVIKSVKHQAGADLPLDQGEIGSCTGNAMVGMLMSEPFHNAIVKRVGRELDEGDAVGIYSEATHIDHFRGIFPPDDTGSSGLAVCKVVQKRFWVSGYAHCFSLDHLVRTLVLQPVIAGTAWLTGMDNPDNSGLIHATGSERGGHEYMADELVIVNPTDLTDPGNLIGILNSWSAGWGKGGHAYMPLPEFDLLRKNQGDVKTVIV